jgi:hypothetical protein
MVLINSKPFSEIESGSHVQTLTAAAEVKKFRVTNARMGLRSRVPPRGGTMPRKRFRYGSHTVLRAS